MKDEVIELLAPDLLVRYRRWKPWFTAVQAIAASLTILTQVIAIWDSQQYWPEHYETVFYMLYSAVALWVISAVIEKRMTRGISLMGALFSSRLRWIISGVWMAGSITAYATMNTIYEPLFPRH